jgi:hypothetical protein
MWSWGEELYTDAEATLAGVTKKNDAAFLLFLSFGIDEDEHLALVHFVLKHQQTAVLVDHQGFANFTEFAAFVAATLSLQAHLVELALAAAGIGLEHFGHGAMMRWRTKCGQLPRWTGVPGMAWGKGF